MITYKILDLQKTKDNLLEELQDIGITTTGNMWPLLDQLKKYPEDHYYDTIKFAVGVAAWDTKEKKYIGLVTLDQAHDDNWPQLNTFVNNKYRRQGIGTKLLNKILPYSPTKEVEFFHTYDGTPFYKNYGFGNSSWKVNIANLGIKYGLKFKIISYPEEKFINPTTYRWISVKTALGYNKKTKAYKIASVLYNRYKRESV